jgi:recombination protein RecR
MDNSSLGPLERLKEQLQKLPGIGPRSAERIAFHLLRESAEYAGALAQAVRDVKQSIRHCKVCYNLAEHELCSVCADPGRDQGEIWVVEQPKDVITLESSALIRGVYHVLMGHIAPLDGIEPADLTIDALLRRVRTGDVHEVVLATNPTLEGDGTALHIQSLLADLKVKITRPARGLAVGSQLEYATAAMLEAAVRSRTSM